MQCQQEVLCTHCWVCEALRSATWLLVFLADLIVQTQEIYRYCERDLWAFWRHDSSGEWTVALNRTVVKSWTETLSLHNDTGRCNVFKALFEGWLPIEPHTWCLFATCPKRMCVIGECGNMKRQVQLESCCSGIACDSLQSEFTHVSLNKFRWNIHSKHDAAEYIYI